MRTVFAETGIDIADACEDGDDEETDWADPVYSLP